MRGGALLVNLFGRKPVQGRKGGDGIAQSFLKWPQQRGAVGAGTGRCHVEKEKGGLVGRHVEEGLVVSTGLKPMEAGGMGRGEERKGGPGAWAVMGLLPRPARNEWWCFVIIRKYSNGLN
jgi:hypothetical protein